MSSNQLLKEGRTVEWRTAFSRQEKENHVTWDPKDIQCGSSIVWNGIFPAISTNKGITAILDYGSPNVNFWAQREPRKNNANDPVVISHSSQWATNSGCEESNLRMLAPDRWGEYERNNFSKPRLLHLHIPRKALNSLTWDIWFSFLNNSLLMFTLPTPCCKLLYNLTPSPPPPNSWEQFS